MAFVVSLGLVVDPFALVMNTTVSATSRVTQISTGATSACAVTSGGSVQCWGDGSYGKLGRNNTASSPTPAPAYTKAGYKETITCQPYERVFGCSDRTVQHGASALYNKPVTKVSVGVNHACAVAAAKVFCWGKNDKGQLGNGKSGALQQEIAPVMVLSHGASALKAKEIVDVSAGDDFTCALASDGMVACWGEGDNGRLGTNSTADKNYPVTVKGHESLKVAYESGTNVVLAQTSPREKSKNSRPSSEASDQKKAAEAAAQQSGSSKDTRVTGLDGKKAVKLAKASATTMCVLAKASSDNDVVNTVPYCWGTGIDSGEAIPANGSSTVTCGDLGNPSRGVAPKSTTSRPTATSKTTIFEASVPVYIPGVTVTFADGSDYVTGLSRDGKAYYWGMYGYRQDTTYSNIKSCQVNACTGKVSVRQQDTVNEALNITVAGSYPKKSTYGSNNKKGTINKSGTNNGKNLGRDYSKGDDRNWQNHQIINGGPVKSSTGLKYNGGGGGGGNSCGYTLYYGFTKNNTYTQVGQKVTTPPPSWPQGQNGMKVVSGNVFNGLFCATSNAKIQCDAHGTSQAEGQAGSGFSQTCKVFSGCSPAEPTGPQKVVETGFLAGKQVQQLATGKTGYTCALASGVVGCWGMNTKGQLGVGDTKHKNVPTEVRL